MCFVVSAAIGVAPAAEVVLAILEKKQSPGSRIFFMAFVKFKWNVQVRSEIPCGAEISLPPQGDSNQNLTNQRIAPAKVKRDHGWLLLH